jgi:cell division protein FtsW
MKTQPRSTRALSLARPYDVTLLLAVLFLVGVGIVMVYSASSAFALRNFGSEYYFLKRQGIFSFLGIIGLMSCRYIPFKLYRVLAYPILLAALILLTAVNIPGWGIEAGGAKRWLSLGVFSFQPSEFARIALVIYLAYSLNKKQEQIDQFKIGLVPHVIILMLFIGLLLIQPDFGSVVIFAAITWIMLFVGGVRIFHLLGPLLILLPAGYYLLVHEPYRVKRLLAFMDPWQNPADEGYQMVHSLMAFGTGGISGTGIGKSYQKLFYLPEPHTDFIFSVIGEEFGLLGIAGIIILYAVIMYRGIRIARNATDNFGTLIAMGITTAMGLQICVNMGVCLGLLPTKGLTLPFLSYGGTSLLLNMAAMGILMNVAASPGKKA